MEASADMLNRILAELQSLRQAQEMSVSPYLRGDAAATAWAGFRDRRTFLDWAKNHGVKPSWSANMKIWAKGDIARAMEKNKHY